MVESGQGTPEEAICGVQHFEDRVVQPAKDVPNFALGDFTKVENPAPQAAYALPADLIVQPKNETISTAFRGAESEDTNPTGVWRRFYGSKLVRDEDSNQTSARATRYGNLPVVIRKSGRPGSANTMERSILEKLRAAGEDVSDIEKKIARQDEIALFVASKTKELGIEPADGQRFWDIHVNTDLTREETDFLFDFTEKMEQIVQAALAAGYSRQELVQ